MQGLNWFQSFPYCQGREADTHLNTSAQCSLFQNWESIRSRACCKGNIRSTRFDLCTSKSRELWRGFSICHCDRAAWHLKSRAHWKQSTPLWKVTLTFNLGLFFAGEGEEGKGCGLAPQPKVVYAISLIICPRSGRGRQICWLFSRGVTNSGEATAQT